MLWHCLILWVGLKYPPPPLAPNFLLFAFSCLLVRERLIMLRILLPHVWKIDTTFMRKKKKRCRPPPPPPPAIFFRAGMPSWPVSNFNTPPPPPPGAAKKKIMRRPLHPCRLSNYHVDPVTATSSPCPSPFVKISLRGQLKDIV